MKLFISWFYQQELVIYHYFKLSVNPKVYVNKLENISKLLDLSSYGWRKFHWFFYFDFLLNAKFLYCIFLKKREFIDKSLTWRP